MSKKKPLLATITLKFGSFTPDGRVHIITSTLYRNADWYTTNQAQQLLEGISGSVASALGQAAKLPGIDPKSIRFTFQIRDDENNAQPEKNEKQGSPKRRGKTP